MKLKAVTVGHNLTELYMLIGTVRFMRSQTCSRESPDSSDCMPKK